LYEENSRNAFCLPDNSFRFFYGRCTAQNASSIKLDTARLLYAHSRFDEAINVLTAILENEPDNATAYFLRARALYNKANFLAALRDLNSGLAICPGFAQGYYNRAVVYYCMLDYDRSWQDAMRAAQLGYTLDPVFFEQLKEDSGRLN